MRRGPLAVANDMQIQATIEAIFKIELMPGAVPISRFLQIRAVVALGREVLAIDGVNAAACGGMQIVERPDYWKAVWDRRQKAR